ncbi:MAG: hypothetical protein AAGF60_11350 [Pseudomonadota bacterium]
MSAPAVIFLTLQALLFAAWTFMVARTLLRLRRRAVAQSGVTFPGPRASLTVFGHFLRSPEDKQERRGLLAITAVLIAFSLSTQFALEPT